jgi:hypothetical protein
MKIKTVTLALLAVAALWTSWTLGSQHGKAVADKKWSARMKEAFGRLHTSSVTSLPSSCEVGDFVFNLTEDKYYMCVGPGKWVYPNYTRLETTHGEPR